MMLLIPAQQSGRPARRFARQRRKWFRARFPDAERRLHTDNIFQIQFGECGPKPAVCSISGIGYDHPARNCVVQGIADLIQSYLWFGLELNLLRNASLLPAALCHSFAHRVTTGRYSSSSAELLDLTIRTL